MTYTQHQVVKPEVLAATSVGMLEQELIIPRLMTKMGVDKFRGAKDDTVSVRVEGVLPFHTYAWRNNRSSPVIFDTYSERKIDVSFGNNYYSAVQLTDEQYDFDLLQWGKLLRPQVRAVARGLGRAAVSELTGAAYEVTIGDIEGDFRGAIIEARRVLNAFNVPDGQRYLLVGSSVEAGLLNEPTITFAQNAGDANAASALNQASLGSLFGFNVVVDQTIAADTAYAFAGSAFVFLNAAPYVPNSVPFGSTASLDGITMRWVRDYDPSYMVDRSVVNTYAGFQAVTDVLVGWNDTTKSETVSTAEYMVRGIKLTMGGANDYPADGSELATITGVKTTGAWTP